MAAKKKAAKRRTSSGRFAPRRDRLGELGALVNADRARAAAKKAAKNAARRAKNAKKGSRKQTSGT